MRSATSTYTSSLDVRTSKIIVEYRWLKGGDTSNSIEQIVSPGLKFCESVTILAGEQYSFCWIGIPINRNLDEAANQIALKLSGPTGRVRPMSRAAAYYYENGRKVQLFSGLVTEYGHEIYEDTAGGFLVDDKFQLERVNCFGRVIYDPRPPEQGGIGGNQYWFDSSEPLVFNANGVGDCIDSPNGPRFAPSIGFGRTFIDNTIGYEEPAQGEATNSTRSWRINDMIRYLRDIYYINPRGLTQGDFTLDRVNTDIIWPLSMGQGIKGCARIKRNFDINGKNLNRCLTLILRAAGTYDLFCQPYGFRSVLKIVDMNPETSRGTILRLPNDTYLNASDIVTVARNASQIIHGGVVKESVMNMYHQTQIVGDPPILELMCSTYNPKNSYDEDYVPSDTLGQYILENAWSSLDEEALRLYVSDNGDSEAAFKDAYKIWPWVYAAYRVVGRYVPWKDTKWSKCVSHGHPRIRESLLTAPLGNDTQNINDWIPLEYKWEYLDDEGQWQECEIADGMQLTPDRRIILLPGLREARQTFRNTDTSGNLFKGTTLRPRYIRATLAIEGEWPLVGLNKLDPNRVGGLISSERKFTFSTVGNPGDYVELLRHPSSRPSGTKTVEPWLTRNYPARCTQGQELFTDAPSSTSGRIGEHAQFRQSDVYRTEYNGFVKIQSMNCSLLPGTNVIIKGTNTVPVEGVVKSMTVNTNEQSITVELTSHDRINQYDNQQGTAVPPTVLPEEQDDGHPQKRDSEGQVKSTEEKQEDIRKEKMMVYEDPSQMQSSIEATNAAINGLLNTKVTQDQRDEGMRRRRERNETQAELDQETE